MGRQLYAPPLPAPIVNVRRVLLVPVAIRVTASVTTPWESLTGARVAQTQAIPWEAATGLSAVSASVTTPWEAVVGVQEVPPWTGRRLMVVGR